MANIINYANELTFSFSEKEFSNVDSLILCVTSYLDFSTFVGTPIFNGYSIPLDLFEPIACYEKSLLKFGCTERDLTLFHNMIINPRFKNFKINYYSSIISQEKQISFGALTYILPNNVAYIAFRGTLFTTLDMHEDLSMSFSTPIPSQLEAVKYLNMVGKTLSNYSLMIGGLSKGGNLAIYAAAYCHEDVKKRIMNIYSHDGPGFLKGTIDEEKIFSIKDRVSKTVPRFSIVGRLLSSDTSYKVVDSTETGILQHDAYSWLVQDSEFLYLPNVSKLSTFIHNTLNKWIYELSPEKREFFASTLYKLTIKNSINPESLLHNSWEENLLDIIFSSSTTLSTFEKKEMINIFTALISSIL